MCVRVLRLINYTEQNNATPGEQEEAKLDAEDGSEDRKSLQITLKGSTGMRVNRALEVMAKNMQKRQTRHAQVR